MKFSKKDKLELSDTSVSDLFILNNMIPLEGIDVKLYLYILFLQKNNVEMDEVTLAKRLCVTEQEIRYSLERLETEELLLKTSDGYSVVDLKDVEINKSYVPKVETKKTRAQSEKERRRLAAANAISECFFKGMMNLGWYTDIGALFEKYAFSEDVMIALFNYCQERKSINRNYVFAVAETWYNGGVKTFEQLENFLEQFDKIQKIKKKITKALRLNRNLTKYEEQYIDKWINDYKYDFNMIEQALKLTVTKSNPSLNYVNGILKNWYEKGFKTVDDLQKENKEEETIKSKIKKVENSKSTYQNYEQRSYDNLEEFYDNM